MSRFVPLSLALVLLASPAAFATETGGVKIRGNVDMTTQVGNAANLALGERNIARNQIGTIAGKVDIQGNVKMSTYVGNAINVAFGKENRACQQIGVISSDTLCE